MLGVPVKQHDDNSRQSMVDTKIHTADAQIPLEVVMDVAEAVMKQAKALDRFPNGIPLPTGSRSWLVMVSRGSRISKLSTSLPCLLAALDPADTLEQVPETLARLGVRAISATDVDGPPRISLFGEGVSYGGAGPDLNVYVEQFLERTPDEPYKLALAAGPDRAHAFIWATITSKYKGWSAFREDHPLPSAGPDLPPGVTDLWLAMTHIGRRVIRYSPEHGWERTNRAITLDDEASLHPEVG